METETIGLSDGQVYEISKDETQWTPEFIMAAIDHLQKRVSELQELLKKTGVQTQS